MLLSSILTPTRLSRGSWQVGTVPNGSGWIGVQPADVESLKTSLTGGQVAHLAAEVTFSCHMVCHSTRPPYPPTPTHMHCSSRPLSASMISLPRDFILVDPCRPFLLVLVQTAGTAEEEEEEEDSSISLFFSLYLALLNPLPENRREIWHLEKMFKYLF